MSDGDAEPQAPVASHPPTEYITLNPNAEPLRLESLCTNCMKNVRGRAQPSAAPARPKQSGRSPAQGTTTMLMTKIPFFREARHSRPRSARWQRLSSLLAARRLFSWPSSASTAASATARCRWAA